jgi:molybdopterin-binding protein
MKILPKYILPLCLFCLGACDGMNDLHQLYLERGEEIYTGIIDSLKVFPGNNRVMFTWQINSDPRITKTVIYWNEGLDSCIVEVNRTQTGSVNMDVTLDILEGNYVFDFITRDNEGHRSLSTERSVEIYGSQYAVLLRNRVIKSLDIVDENSLNITWTPAETTVRHTVIKYIDYTDAEYPEEKTVTVDNSDTATILSKVKSGEKFFVISSHLPKGSLDTFDALPREYTIP